MIGYTPPDRLALERAASARFALLQVERALHRITDNALEGREFRFIAETQAELLRSIAIVVERIATDEPLGGKARARAHYEAMAADARAGGGRCEGCQEPEVVDGPSGRICMVCDFAQREVGA